MSTYILGRGIEMETSETNASTRYENIQKKQQQEPVFTHQKPQVIPQRTAASSKRGLREQG